MTHLLPAHNDDNGAEYQLEPKSRTKAKVIFRIMTAFAIASICIGAGLRGWS